MAYCTQFLRCLLTSRFRAVVTTSRGPADLRATTSDSTRLVTTLAITSTSPLDRRHPAAVTRLRSILSSHGGPRPLATDRPTPTHAKVCSIANWQRPTVVVRVVRSVRYVPLCVCVCVHFLATVFERNDRRRSIVTTSVYVCPRMSNKPMSKLYQFCVRCPRSWFGYLIDGFRGGGQGAKPPSPNKFQERPPDASRMQENFLAARAPPRTPLGSLQRSPGS